MGGTVNESCINVYDFSEGCQLAGHMSNGLFHLFHYGEQVHVSLEIVETSFRGRDHSNGLQFSGGVNGPRIWIKDHANLRRHAYWCEAPQVSRLPSQESDDFEADRET